MVMRFYERLNLWRAVRLIVLVAIILVFTAAGLEWIVEPETFTSYGLACWWAVVTVTTVGYGDIVPHSTGGRLVAAVLMLVGLSLIPTLTSVIVSTLISKRSRAAEERTDKERMAIEASLARIERRIEQLEKSQGS
jgi:voltage-gated potassium channel